MLPYGRHQGSEEGAVQQSPCHEADGGRSRTGAHSPTPSVPGWRQPGDLGLGGNSCTPAAASLAEMGAPRAPACGREARVSPRAPLGPDVSDHFIILRMSPSHPQTPQSLLLEESREGPQSFLNFQSPISRQFLLLSEENVRSQGTSGGAVSGGHLL